MAPSVVIKGGSRSGGGNLATHLLRTDTNERSEVLELKGVAADRLPEALAEMEAVATGTRCRKSLYHASINTGPGEELTLHQKAEAVAALELRLGLAGHARAVVEHRKEGRDHLHVVWTRIDVDTMRAVHDGHNYRAHEEVARQLEREFGHNRVQGAHHERDGPEGGRKPRPERTPPSPEVQQAARTKRDPAGVTAEVTRLWQGADSGAAFAAALDGAGYVLAQGDRRGFCVVDQAGGSHSLARRIEGATTREVNARLAGIELASLPTVAQARDQVREREATRTTAIDLQPVREVPERTADPAPIQTPQPRPQEAHREPEAAAGRDVPPAGPEATHAAPERGDGRDLPQRSPDRAVVRPEVRTRSLIQDIQPDRVTGGIAKAAGALLDAATGLLGLLLGSGGKPTRQPAPTRQAGPAPAPTPAPQARPAPPRPQPPAPAPSRPSAADELAAAARERRARLGPRPAAPEPKKEPERDGGRSLDRPALRLIASLPGASPDVLGWVKRQREKLLAYSQVTGAAVWAELQELDGILAAAILGGRPSADRPQQAAA